MPNRTWYGEREYVVNIWLRGFLYWLFIFTYWHSFNYVEMGDAATILFASPVLTVLLGKFYLKESLPRLYPISFVLTIAGVIFACQPSFIFTSSDSTSISYIGLILLIIAVIAKSLESILIRTARASHWLQLEIVASLQSAFMWTPLVILLNYTWLHSSLLSGGSWDYSLETILVLIALGILGFVGLLCYVVGYQLGDATKVSWLEYLNVIVPLLYQWLVFNETPNKYEIIGCLLLVLLSILNIAEGYYRYYQSKKSVVVSNNLEHEIEATNI